MCSLYALPTILVVFGVSECLVVNFKHRPLGLLGLLSNVRS